MPVPPVVRGAHDDRVVLGSCPLAGIGMWRSLVAHLTGGQGVAGSNPVIPTEKSREPKGSRDFFVRGRNASSPGRSQRRTRRLQAFETSRAALRRTQRRRPAV